MASIKARQILLATNEATRRQILLATNDTEIYVLKWPFIQFSLHTIIIPNIIIIINCYWINMKYACSWNNLPSTFIIKEALPVFFALWRIQYNTIFSHFERFQIAIFQKPRCKISCHWLKTHFIDNRGNFNVYMETKVWHVETLSLHSPFYSRLFNNPGMCKHMLNHIS